VAERSNVVVMADEAHRSQYGFVEGGARWLREALPNATFVGFTGTPLERDDKNTIYVFGEYADVYDIRQAVEDGATRPLYYESRIVKLKVDEAGARVAEDEIEYVVNADRSGEAADENIRVPLESLVGAPERIERLAAFIVEHWEKRRAAMEGKAMVVTMSRDIAARLYEAIRALRPDWHDADDERGAMKVIVTGSSEDVEPLRSHVRSKAARKRLAERFKNPDDDLRLVIVCDMWLTGFDCPPAHTMYLDKPLAGHNLMQAIARVNRVLRDKPGGLVVDYIGIAADLKDAVSRYAAGGGRGKPAVDIEEALEALLRHLDVARSLLAGFDMSAIKRNALAAITGAANHVLGLPPTEDGKEGKKRFADAVLAVSQAYALCRTHEDAEPLREEIAFLQAVKAILTKQNGADEKKDSRAKDAVIRQLLSDALTSDGVVDIFAAAGLDKPDIGILSEEFLSDVRNLKQRNLAVELLQRLLKDEIRARFGTNIVQLKKYSELLDGALNRYKNRAVETAQVIEELIALAKNVNEAVRRGDELKLNTEELAFYDALETNEASVRELGDDVLRAIARDLADTIRKNASIDWNKRDAVRAKLRIMVKNVLRKYKYPPDKQAAAVELVIRQAEALTEARLAE
jgi:type I restriction enzyme R subunit